MQVLRGLVGRTGGESIAVQTPFTYSDPVKQERNQAGHDRQEVVFTAFSLPEGSENGVEFKFDRKQHETGNWFVEAENRGMPSGIAITKVRFWVMQSPSDSLFVPPAPLREFIEHKKLLLVSGPENSRGYLVNAAEFRKWNHDRISA